MSKLTIEVKLPEGIKELLERLVAAVERLSPWYVYPTVPVPNVPYIVTCSDNTETVSAS